MVLRALCMQRADPRDSRGANLHFKTHIKKIMKIGAGETAVLEKRLSGKLKGLRSDSQNTCKKPSDSVCVCRPGGVRDRLTPGACWPARLAPVSPRPLRDPVSKKRGKVRGSSWR